MTLGLAIRISAFAFGTGCLVLFVSGYVDLRSELVRATRELSLARDKNLAVTRLGHAVLRDSGLDAAAGGTASFLGCFLPLVVAVIVPSQAWIGIVVAIAMLAVLGAALARSIGGRWLTWSIILAASGMVLTGVGLWLQIA
ncbi:hypothetical protein [Microlunatus endophyticus]|nr:hypothetical protein [Microlunatus endophyticus]